MYAIDVSDESKCRDNPNYVVFFNYSPWTIAHENTLISIHLKRLWKENNEMKGKTRM